MNKKFKKILLSTAISSVFFLTPVLAQAATDAEYNSLKAEVQSMHADMVQMRQLLKEQGVLLNKKTAPKITREEVYALKKQVKKIAKVAKSAEEWKNTNSNIQMSGFADVTYSNNKGDNGAIDSLGFSPIFHYGYKDILFVESEAEFGIDPAGATTTNIEYLSLDLFLNDYATFVAGKFLSPIGQFRQNGHPSWINKLPSKPVGFMNKEAAPVADLGIGFRGGLPLANTGMEMNYAVYASNGPEITQTGGVLDGIDSDAPAPRDADGNKVYGGRLGLRPVSGLEIGFSGGFGKVAITDGAGARLSGETDRNYRIIGSDFNYGTHGLNLRGEYARQKIAASSIGVAKNQAEWSTYYLQASYKIPSSFKLPDNLEAVVRYGNYDANKIANDKRQWAFGMNYLFAPQLIAKVAYEINDGHAGSTNNNDSFLAQIAYGF